MGWYLTADADSLVGVILLYADDSLTGKHKLQNKHMEKDLSLGLVGTAYSMTLALMPAGTIITA